MEVECAVGQLPLGVKSEGAARTTPDAVPSLAANTLLCAYHRASKPHWPLQVVTAALVKFPSFTGAEGAVKLLPGSKPRDAGLDEGDTAHLGGAGEQVPVRVLCPHLHDARGVVVVDAFTTPAAWL